jgi:polyisoprenoid-binding protein YceI
MTKFFVVAAALLMGICAKSQIYLGKTCEISFFSKGPIEDIYAINKITKPILNTANNEVALKITIKGFEFKSGLMEEHFNEKYMESDKFPYATFTGKINEPIDYKKDSTYKVTVTGKLTMHGVEKERTVDATAIIKDGEITFESKFNVALKDHNITIPSLLSKNIAEVMEITVKGVLTEFKK